jgi:hypothetical protein
MVRGQHALSNLQRLGKQCPGSVEIRGKWSKSMYCPRGLLVLVAVHAAMPVEGLLEKSASPLPVARAIQHSPERMQ